MWYVGEVPAQSLNVNTWFSKYTSDLVEQANLEPWGYVLRGLRVSRV